MGKLIVIEGLDGSGKATQAKKLADALREDGYNVMQITFPDYDSPSSSLVQMYLNGEFGKNPNSVNAYAASTFYAVDRFASYKKKWENFYNAGGIVVADRYITSNAVHQCAKLPKTEWKKFLSWLFDFEINLLGLPEPYRVIYLDVNPSLSQGLMAKRYFGDDSKKDIHEKDLRYLFQCRKAAEFCCQYFNWDVIRCDDGISIRPIEDIHSEIKALLYSETNINNCCQ